MVSLSPTPWSSWALPPTCCWTLKKAPRTKTRTRWAPTRGSTGAAGRELATTTTTAAALWRPPTGTRASLASAAAKAEAGLAADWAAAAVPAAASLEEAKLAAKLGAKLEAKAAACRKRRRRAGRAGASQAKAPWAAPAPARVPEQAPGRAPGRAPGPDREQGRVLDLGQDREHPREVPVWQRSPRSSRSRMRMMRWKMSSMLTTSRHYAAFTVCERSSPTVEKFIQHFKQHLTLGCVSSRCPLSWPTASHRSFTTR
mmetsp:Transcript_87885/g.210024  ORF Transcript_87885/g.210024 Transcript_87885/m.210024 type:complete len:257 (+) Transcript_87885:3505-4275(+)